MPATLRMRSAAALSTLLAGLMLASVFFAPATDAARMSRQERIHVGADIVRNQKGDPYHYGSAGPDRFDCSGLIYYSYRRAGFDHMPRTSSAQARFARHIKRRNMRRGDFVFFYDGGGVYHVGMYGGRNKDGHRFLIHAPYGNGHVRRERIWTNKWFAGTLRRR